MSNHQAVPVAQMDIEEARENEERRRQRTCRHHFLFAHLFDFANDRVLDIAECERCKLQK